MADPGYSGPIQHQNFQGFPKLDAPLVDSRGYLTLPWYRLLMTVWQRTGSGFTQLPNAVTLESSGGPLTPVNALTGQTGEMIGPVVISGSPQADQITMETLAVAPPTFSPPPPEFDPLEGVVAMAPVEPTGQATPPWIQGPGDQLRITPIIETALELALP